MSALTICRFWTKKIKFVTVSTVSPYICYEVIGPDATILLWHSAGSQWIRFSLMWPLITSALSCHHDVFITHLLLSFNSLKNISVCTFEKARWFFLSIRKYTHTKCKKSLKMVIIKLLIHRFHKDPQIIPALKATSGAAMGICWLFFFFT